MELIVGKKLEYYYFGKKLAKQIIKNRNQKNSTISKMKNTFTIQDEKI